ncbi:hypothetical protein ERD95_17385 [Enterobacteriaceae bacterium ML5]|nr:hypothetical protein ERD95_17385 [Enterobacteriaceae bacterium ML5]
MLKSKKIIVVASFSLMLIGCSSFQHSWNDSQFQTKEHGLQSVSSLQSLYLQRFGDPMPAPERSSKCITSLCWFNSHAEVFAEAEYAQMKKNEELENARKISKEEDENRRCKESPDCLKNREINNYQSKLRQNYQYVLATNPYLQDDYDYAVRNMCEKSAEAESSGISKDTLLNNMRDVAGVSPRSRVLIINVADACWNLSKLGSNWKEALR